jgi:putative flavoprotein involved in K+ transport
MTVIDTVVIGAGHAGLAVSRLLTAARRDHVVLERGRVGERWRSARWDSLHLLTPNWMTRLPGQPFDGPDPDSFMSAGRLVGHLERYAASFDAPVVNGVEVLDLSAARAGGYLVTTDAGTWRASCVVIATGPHAVPRLPAGLEVPARPDVPVLSAGDYRNPAQLGPGGVLIVGASSSGVQIADELNRSGREVVLAVGRHTRLPRTYRGMDIFWWLERTGRLGRTIDDVRDPAAARREPSLQLIGRPSRDDVESDAVDLVALQTRGVRLAGRFLELAAGRARFQPDLTVTAAAADRTMQRVLDRVDDHIRVAGLAGEVLAVRRPTPLRAPAPLRSLHLARAGITTVLVATGYRPQQPWLRLPITDADGTIRQRRGVTPAPGVYVVGQRFQHRRDSGFIGGARHDARAIVHHMTTGCAPESDDQRHEEPAA